MVARAKCESARWGGLKFVLNANYILRNPFDVWRSTLVLPIVPDLPKPRTTVSGSRAV